MTQLYLILHKVRGKPSFDVAVRDCEGPIPCQPDCGLFNGESCMAVDEDWWTIPTSGHRAYPYWHQEITLPLIDPPAEWPDHYWQPGQVSDIVIPSNAGSGLLARLGFAKQIVKRRI